LRKRKFFENLKVADSAKLQREQRRRRHQKLLILVNCCLIQLFMEKVWKESENAADLVKNGLRISESDSQCNLERYRKERL